jgi:hypothetical protein
MPTTVGSVAAPASRADDGLGLLTGPNTGKGQDVLDKFLVDISPSLSGRRDPIWKLCLSFFVFGLINDGN